MKKHQKERKKERKKIKTISTKNKTNYFSINTPGFEVGGLPMCEICFHRNQGTMCVECNKPIYGNALTILGKKRHPQCFICAFCKKNLTKETAKAKDEKLYCNSCILQLFG